MSDVMARIMLTRRHPGKPDAVLADVTGAHSQTLGAMVARTRIGTTCTLWMDSIKALGGVAQITRVRPDAFLVDVLVGTHMLEVVAPARGNEIIVLHPSAARARRSGIAHAASLIDSSEAAATAHAWVRHQALAHGWELRRQV
ncbi:hypothetical protein ASE34_01160 [Microbacterium sp. Root280D1]|nr:hypothetical protein ASE34_01160 [Microbacterium sp. Root280D1]